MTKKEFPGSFWRKVLIILLSPYVISLVVAILIIFLFFPVVTKYKISIIEIQKYKPQLVTYDDLNGDGISDWITLTQDTSNYFSLLIIENPSSQINQWNFEGRLINYSTNDYLMIGDFDDNHKKEIYIFSLSHDSVMLHCISDIKNNVPEFKNVFITKVGFGRGKYDAGLVKAEMDDLNDDGYKELIFGINTGFGLIPRNIFAYDLHNKRCISSPYLGQTIDRIVQKDITGDGKNEILIQGHGQDNIKDTAITFHDRSAWLMVLDRKLNFLFKPIEFKGAYSNICPFVFEGGKKLNQAGFYVHTTVPPELSKLCLFSQDGKIFKEQDLHGLPTNGIYDAFTFADKGKTFLALTEPAKDVILVFDQDFQFFEKKKVVNYRPIARLDLDKDGQNEIISFNPGQSKLVIIRSNLQHQVTIGFPYNSPERYPLFSLKENGDEMPELVIWDHSALTFLHYQLNLLFYFRWIIFLGIYSSILLFTWFTRRIQRYQIEQKIKIEKKITELQMTIVKNQLDPHFTLNAVNSIIYAVGNNEPERATEHLYHFSNLYRHLLLTADQYKCSLKDELSFTENYLKMEQLRFRDKYSYVITIPEEINQDIEVPKMCIQTAVENALKHGIAPLKSGGEISVKALTDQNSLVIEISDNGIGRDAAKQNQHSSTHKGIKLTQQYFELFTKITNRKVTSEVIDLKDDSGNAAGTKIRIAIQLN